LLNIAPGPNGDFDQIAYDRLKEIGSWMKVNGEAIYGTKPISPYQSGSLVFTAKGQNIYVIYLVNEGEKFLPEKIALKGLSVPKGSKISIFGASKVLRYTIKDNVIEVEIPSIYRSIKQCDYAITFKILK